MSGFEVTLDSNNPAEGEIGTFNLEFFVHLNEFSTVTYKSPFTVTIKPSCDTGIVNNFVLNGSPSTTAEEWMMDESLTKTFTGTSSLDYC